MRTIPIAVAVFALLSGAVSAQTPQTAPSRDDSTRPSPSATTAPTKPAPAINPLTQEDVSWIAGTTVYGSDDTKIGNISTVLMDSKTKQINRLVIAAGGVLGIGSHYVAIPVDQFSWDGERAVFKLSKDLASLKAMPGWVEGGTATGTSQPAGNKMIAPAAGDSESPSR
jgi:sporulation protein YlmC with PRC-barrel domain